MKQWTYVYWDETRYIVMHQRPDPMHKGRVISTEIVRGFHEMMLPRPDSGGYSAAYATRQIEIGLPYATPEYPLRTCEGKIVEKQEVTA